MTAPLCLGVDPGQEGAAALVRGEEVLGVVVWARLDRKGGDVWRVRRSLHYQPWSPWDPWEDVGHLKLPDAIDSAALLLEDARAVGRGDDLPWEGVDAVVIEGLFVPKKKKGQRRDVNPQSALRTAHNAGMWAYALRSGPEPLRPKASSWRPEVLDIPGNTPADVAEAAAIRLMRARVGWEAPEEWRADEKGHAAEAVALAVYGVGRARRMRRVS